MRYERSTTGLSDAPGAGDGALADLGVTFLGAWASSQVLTSDIELGRVGARFRPSPCLSQ
jgi:hypothetical protein